MSFSLERCQKVKIKNRQNGDVYDVCSLRKSLVVNVALAAARATFIDHHVDGPGPVRPSEVPSISSMGEIVVLAAVRATFTTQRLS